MNSLAAVFLFMALVPVARAEFALDRSAMSDRESGPTVRAPDDGITRVLIIGNSFSACVMDHLPPVAADRGVKLDVCSLFIGGCSLARHWKNACLDGTPDEPQPYLLTRDTCGKGETNHINVCTALRMEDWDIVTVQQASGDSWRAETYGPEGDRLVAKIRELAPHAKVYVQETWSYTPWDKRLKKWGITPDEMYAKLHAAYAAFARRNGLDVIPFGAAVQEWRRRLPVRYTANSFGGDVIGEDVLPADTLFKRNAKGEWVINCDAFHTGQRGNYFQGLVWAATLLGIDPEAVGYRPDFVTESDGRLMKRIAKELAKE